MSGQQVPFSSIIYGSPYAPGPGLGTDAATARATDEQLLERFAAGGRDAREELWTADVCLQDLPPEELERLFHCLVTKLRHLGRLHADAQDLAQVALVKGLRAGQLRSPRAWLLQVATREGKKLSQTARRRDEKLRGPVRERMVAAQDSRVQLAIEDVQAAIDRLPASMQQVVSLWLEGRSFVAIGEVLEVSQDVARRRWHEAVQRLREMLAA